MMVDGYDFGVVVLFVFLLLSLPLYAKAIPLSLSISASFSHFGGGGGTKMAEISVKLISQANQLARLSFWPDATLSMLD